MKFLYKPIDTLFLNTADIGSGLFLQHGFSTIIVAVKIGNNCWINQQVTIGFSNNNACPKLENNVTVGAG
jgi:serine O-acetyltransferase